MAKSKRTGKAHRADLAEIRSFRQLLSLTSQGTKMNLAYAEVYGETVYEAPTKPEEAQS